MAKKEFTDDFLYEYLKYALWSQDFGDDNVKSCSNYAAYHDFLQTTHRHRGDCTKDSCPCSRCALIRIEIDAQNIVDSLFNRDNEIGYCGKRCLSECNYGKEEKNEQ